MKYLVLQSKVIHTDDTSIKMLLPGSGTTKTCKFWPYLGAWLHPYAVDNFTLTRRNYLFVGSPRGGRGAAILYSLVSSAKANGVEPLAWLKDVFTQLPYYRDGEAFKQASESEPVVSTQLDHLLPDRWLRDNPSHAWNIDPILATSPSAKSKNLGPSGITVG